MAEPDEPDLTERQVAPAEPLELDRLPIADVPLS
jgi:hypothetical protein